MSRQLPVKMRQALSQMVVMYPFYAGIALSTPILPREDIETMATDGLHIYYAPDYAEALNQDELQFVLMHEIEHIVRLHMFRRDSRDPGLWNEAADHVINLDLLKMRLTGPKDARGRFSGLADQKYQGMTTEQLYSKLLKKHKKVKVQTIDPDLAPQHRALKPADVLPPSGNRSEAERQLRGRIRVTVNSVLDSTGSRGIPHHLKDHLSDLGKPKIDWRQQLRDFLTATAIHGQDWSRPNRRLRHLGYRLPTNWAEGVGPIGIIIDTSGSCVDAIGDFLSEVMGIANDAKPERIIVLFIDETIQGRFETDHLNFEADMASWLEQPLGGGGTDLRPAFAELENETELDAVVCLTDMETPWPEDFRYADRTLFVEYLSYGSEPPPFGRSVPWSKAA